ncbi:MAG: tetratricopeptide repeat protein [Acidobacteria bacterium]|nr:tetratricopeptide repeat protein [Acidobacteriota bacterium]
MDRHPPEARRDWAVQRQRRALPRTVGRAVASVRHRGQALRAHRAGRAAGERERSESMNPKKRAAEGRAAFNNPSQPAGRNAAGTVTAQSALGKAVALHLEGKLKEALHELDLAMEHGESTAEIHSARGHIQFEFEQYKEASQSYQKLLEIDPRHPAATFNLAVCLEKLGKWQQAAEGFQRAWETDTKRTDALVGMGVCLLHMDRAQAALDSFEKVLATDTENETALFGKAVALQLTGRLDEAAEVYQRTLEKSPNSEDALLYLISIGIARKDYDTIRKNSERLLQLRPYSQAAVEGLATCAFASGDYEAAAKFCAKLVEFTPDSFER